MPKLAGYYYLSQKTQTPSCYFSILCPTLAGAYLAKLTLSFLGVNLVLESTYIGNHLTQVAPKSDMSFCSFAFGSQPLKTVFFDVENCKRVSLRNVKTLTTYSTRSSRMRVSAEVL